jgi:DNA-binding transcriptional LysR family regulator
MSNRWELLRIFHAAAEAENFRQASIKLGVSPQVVSRAVQELEEIFGEVLFYRSTRRVQITSFGKHLASRVDAAREAFEDLFEEVAANTADETSGIVRITAPATLGRRHVLPALSQVLATHSGLAIDIRLSERIADVVDERIDIGVRIGIMRDSGLVARAITPVPFFVCASPDLLTRCRMPRNVQALHDLPTSALIDANTGRPWPWIFKDSPPFVPRSPAFTTDDPETECEAILGGTAFGQLPGYLAIPHIRSGRLKRMLVNQEPEPFKLYVYRSFRQPVPQRVRLVFDRLVEALSDPDKFPAQLP